MAIVDMKRAQQLDLLDNGRYYRQARNLMRDIRDELTKARKLRA